jgi:hypothetical protein
MWWVVCPKSRKKKAENRRKSNIKNQRAKIQIKNQNGHSLWFATQTSLRGKLGLLITDSLKSAYSIYT